MMYSKVLHLMQKRVRQHMTACAVIAISLSLWACSPSPDEETAAVDQASESNNERSSSSETTLRGFESGNMLYMVRDVAMMQQSSSNYIQQLKQSQNDLEQALDSTDSADLKQSVDQIKSQLKALNHSLQGLKLKSQEVESIRRQILELNQQALKTPLMNGAVELNRENIEKIQTQLDTIQFDMLQLATLIIPDPNADSDS